MCTDPKKFVTRTLPVASALKNNLMTMHTALAQSTDICEPIKLALINDLNQVEKAVHILATRMSAMDLAADLMDSAIVNNLLDKVLFAALILNVDDREKET